MSSSSHSVEEEFLLGEPLTTNGSYEKALEIQEIPLSKHSSEEEENLQEFDTPRKFILSS